MGQFDFYVLALSWSPGFCEISGRRSRQCDGGNDLGFVVHGLWPQMEQGYPSFCEPSGRFVPMATLTEAKGLFPEDNLALYQWRKHGSCSGESPGAYFRTVQRARDRVAVPESFKVLRDRSQVLPSEIEQAFISVNPGLRPNMISVSCGRRILREVRICLDKDLRNFRQCPEVDRDGCRSGEIMIPALR